jgi:hypothetical protein
MNTYNQTTPTPKGALGNKVPQAESRSISGDGGGRSGGGLAPLVSDIITSLVINGDISRLSPVQKVNYYKQFCDKLGLDPLSQPFRILRLHGREILYCDRGGAQQLNKLHKLSHRIKARETVNNCYVVTATATTPDGRSTESIGAVNIGNLKGEGLCNAMMKAETKAKRRATLDLLGLGLLDETEVPPPGHDVEYAAINLYGHEHDNPVPSFGGGAGIPTSLFLSLKGLEREVTNCKTEDELLTLYNDNRHRVDDNADMLQQFTNRKNELRKKVAA